MNKKLFLAVLALGLAACQQRTATPKQDGQQPTARQTQVENDVNSTPMPDFVLPDINGKETSAMVYVKEHQLTIVDFWASWCGPCRAEMPNVVSLYQQYKDKGLGIIGVSLDEDRTAWIRAVTEMHMDWLQLSDLKGWECAAAQQFGVSSIPFTLVVNREGKLMAAGLRGEKMAQLVASLLNE